jgi:hypothetical protein
MVRALRLRIWIWTFGLAYAEYVLAGRGVVENPARQVGGAALGALIGFGIGWGLQRLLEPPRKT